MWARLVGLLSPLLGASSVSLSRRGMGGGRSASASLRVTSNGGRHAVAAGGTSRYFVVGDVHGCLDELEALIALAQLDEGTRLVLVGDLVNKGPKSAETVRWCRARDVLAVRGNHEEALLRQWRKLEAGRPVAATYEYVRDLSTDDVAWIENLPHTISLPSVDAIVVHAGLAPARSLEAQTPADMVYMRSLLDDGSGSVDPGRESWAATRTEAPLVVFGHDARRGLQTHPFAVGLDTGCAYGKKLTGIRLPERTFLSVDAKAMYSAPADLSPAPGPR